MDQSNQNDNVNRLQQASSTGNEETVNRHINAGVQAGFAVPRNGGSRTTRHRQAPQSVVRVRKPMSDFAVTAKYKQILGFAQSMKTLVLHCHGVPGSGKSEIIRKLAQHFPSLESGLCVKWHIQCEDSGHDIKTELKNLLGTLIDNSLLQNKQQCQNALTYIDENYTGPLVDILCKIQVPVLILLEDVKREMGGKKQDLLKDFFRSLEEKRRSVREEDNLCPFHVYMATRQKNACLSHAEYSQMSFYKMECLTGFNRKEGVEFLMSGSSDDKENKRSAEAVYDRFSGSPLGLRIAKRYCHNVGSNYTEYLQAILNSEFDIKQYEDELNREEYGEDAQHVFQAITKQFHVNSESNKEARLTWKVLSCISWLHYDRIPRILFERCCQEVREETVGDVTTANKNESGRIIAKLINHEMCTVADEGDITFHEVVMHAFRLDRRCDSFFDNFNPLKSSISVLASLVTKDLRETAVTKKMHKLIRHGQSLLKHTEAKKDFLDHSLILWMTISYLYETLGAVILAKSPSFRQKCNDYFKRALTIIWEAEKPYSLTQPSHVKVDDVAKYVVAECRSAGDKLPYNFVVKYTSKIMLSFTNSEVRFLEKQGNTKFALFEKANASGSGNEDLILKLQESGVFLKETPFKQIFYAARLASILHSWSREILYKDNFEKSTYDKHMWYSSLSRAISKKCRELYGIGLLTEHLATSNGMIPIILKQKGNSDALIEAQVWCESALEGPPEWSLTPMYEHGLQKEVFDSSHLSGKISILKFLVKIYTRLDDPQYFEVGHQRCRELFNLVTQPDNLITLSNSLLCVINCAKYYASKKEFDKALGCFNFYFDKEKSIPQYHNVHSWALYNYARATHSGRMLAEVKRAISFCQATLQSNEIMDSHLNTRLKNILCDLLSLKSSM